MKDIKENYELEVKEQDEFIKQIVESWKPFSKTIMNLEKANLLLRRVYNIIEMSHLNDNKLTPFYCNEFIFSRQLGSDIFNYLQSKDEDFRNIVIRRQKRYRNRIKKAKKRELKNGK